MSTHLVIPLWTPALQARTPFMLLITLLFPTLGKPDDGGDKKQYNDTVIFNQLNTILYFVV